MVTAMTKEAKGPTDRIEGLMDPAIREVITAGIVVQMVPYLALLQAREGVLKVVQEDTAEVQEEALR